MRQLVRVVVNGSPLSLDLPNGYVKRKNGSSKATGIVRQLIQVVLILFNMAALRIFLHTEYSQDAVEQAEIIPQSQLVIVWIEFEFRLRLGNCLCHVFKAGNHTNGVF